MSPGDEIIKSYSSAVTEEQSEDGEVEILQGENGKHYPPKWIPVNRRETPEEPVPPPDDISDSNLYYFKKDLTAVLINIILFCSNLDLFRVELTRPNQRITMIVLVSISFFIQVILGISTVINSPFFSGNFKRSNVNFLNDLNLCGIFLLLIDNISLWVCDVLDK